MGGSGFSQLVVFLGVSVLLLVPSSAALLSPPSSSPAVQAPRFQPATARLSSLPSAYFTENEGQVANPQVRFYSSAGAVDVGFAESAVLLAIHERPRAAPGDPGDIPRGEATSDWDVGVGGVLVRLSLEGARPVLPQGRGELPFRSHFFLGNDPTRWRTDVANFREVVYPGLYDGIDLVYRATESGLKYEFIVGPWIDPSRIAIRFEGIEGLVLEANGDLVIRTAVGDIRDSGLVAYQGPRNVSCSNVLRSDDFLGFVCAGRVPSEALTIDPLVYATFLGGSAHEQPSSLAIDLSGNAYLGGGTVSPDFPATPGAFNTSYTGNGMGDAFVAKLNPAGDALVYATYLGGRRADFVQGLAIDPSGDVYATGLTDSSDFPVTLGAFDLFENGQDAFVVKLNPAGSALLYSTFLGGSGSDEGWSLAVDASRNAIIVGDTTSTDFPTTVGALDRSCGTDGLCNGGSDAFVAKLNASGTGLAYGTFVGGSSYETAYAVVADGAGDALVTGMTLSWDFPVTAGAYDTSYNGGQDVFVAKLEPLGDILSYSAFLGGTGDEEARAIATDPSGAAYVAGGTLSSDFPTAPGAFDRDCGTDGMCDGNVSSDAFATKVAPDGRSLVFSTYLGGAEMDRAWGVAVDAGGQVYLSGDTWSPDFPTTPAALDRMNNGNGDQFVARLDPAGAYLEYGTFLGGRSTDEYGRIAVDAAGAVFVCGETFSPNFPVTPGALDTTYGGGGDNFVAKLELDVVPGPFTTIIVGSPSFTATATYVTSATLLSYYVSDPGGTGIRRTLYRIDGGTWVNYSATGPFTLSGDGVHLLEWFSEDWAGNVETTRSSRLRVDDAPPATSIAVDVPKYQGSELYVTSATPITLTAADRGVTPVGLDSTEYRVDAGTWSPYASRFTLAGTDGPRTIEYRSRDLLGNTEAVRTFRLVLDDTPPATSISPTAPPFPAGTRFALSAMDAGSGVNRTDYRVDGGNWTPYTTPFALPEGNHVVRYRSIDNLGNPEAERTLNVAMEVVLPVELNWKPVVALVFSAILLVAGAWSSKRAPWRGGKGRRAALEALAVSALPFVLIEAATGVVSLFTGLLSIPPVLGLGTAVDAGILLAGLAVVVYRAANVRRPHSQSASR